MPAKKPYNPSRRFGRRNLDCPHYERCLDVAVRHAWHTFSCGQCPSRDQQVRLRVEELEGDAPGWEEIWAQADGMHG